MKYTIEYINESLPDKWKLISDKYENLDGELILNCPEGHEIHTSWRKIRNKCECPTCKANPLKSSNKKFIERKKGQRVCIGFDQATHITGYAVIVDDKLIDYGTYEAKGKTEIERISKVRQFLLSMIENWEPDIIGFEGIQLQDESQEKSNIAVTTYKILAELLGALKVTAAEANTSFEECHTGIWRKYCGVKGKSRTDKKSSMQMIVKKWYDITVTNDEADAIGIARYLNDVVLRKIIIHNWF